MAVDRVERRIAAILAADVVGYSQLVGCDEESTLALLKDYRALIDGLIGRYQGRIFGSAGDSVIAEFASPVEAVRCATEIQLELDRRNAALPEAKRMRFRIGINLGDVVVESDDLLGDGVNVAARLEQLCDPGGVLISGTAFDHLRGKFALPLDFAGEQKVKNIAKPVRAYRVRLGESRIPWRLRLKQHRKGLLRAAALVAATAIVVAGAWWLTPVESAIAAKPSIAVLPFDNIGGDETTGRFADGVTEDIITDLSRFRDVDVIARNSTAVYKGKPVDVRKVGEELDVRYVLEGSVQRQADQIRITAQLIAASTAAHLWSDRWDRPLSDLFSVQAEISGEVARRLLDTEGAITTAEHVAGRRSSPGDLTAYELYLRGREAIHHFTKGSVTEAISLLQQAVEKDSGLARAWDELGAAYSISIDFGAEAAEARAKALEATERAMALDPRDALSHAHLGHFLGMQGEFERSKAEFEEALRLNPGSADVIMIYVSWATTYESPERAAELVDRVIRLDPKYPSWATGPFAFAYIMADRFEDALRVLEQQSTDNYTLYSWVFRASANAMLGRGEEARLWMERTLEKHPGLSIEGFLAGPDWTTSDRKQMDKVMREARFPICAEPEQLLPYSKPVRVPECVKG